MAFISTERTIYDIVFVAVDVDLRLLILHRKKERKSELFPRLLL